MAPRRKGYQLNIDVPTSVGPAPTAWREPKEPTIRRTTWTAPSAGVTRFYGATDGYLDTIPHRWTTTGKKSVNTRQINRNQTPPKTVTSPPPTPPNPFATPPYKVTGVPVPPPPSKKKVSPSPAPFAMPPIPSTGMAVPPPPSKGKVSPSPASMPPMPSTGTAIPPAPTGATAKRVLKNTDPLGVPPMPDFGGDFLTMSAREASDEPFESGVEWKDEPKNPFPKGGREDFDTSRMFDPTYKSAQERSTKTPNSRTQNRKPKNT